MKEIIYNKDNIEQSSIDETVIRLKAIIFNNKNEILLGKCYNTYQFPGGHLNPKEDLTTGLIREVKEETGIELTNISPPFALIKNYSKNYRNTGKNRLNLIYYYYFTGSYTPDPTKTNLDTYEIEGNYHTIYIPLSCFKTTINKTIHLDPINPIMYHEMSLIIDLLNKKIK